MLNISVGNAMYQALKKIADEQGRSVPALVVSILKQWIKDNSTK